MSDLNTPNETPETETESTKTRQMSFHILDDGTIRADFVGGEVPSLTLPLSDVPEALKISAIADGVISRARGYASKLAEDERTPQNLAKQIALAFANIRAGIWKAPRATSAVTEYSIEIESAWLFRKMKAEARGEAFSDTLESVSTLWESLTDGQRKQVKDLPRYKAAFAQVKAQRQAKKAEKLLRKAETDEADSPV